MKGNWAAYEERNRELGNLLKKKTKKRDRQGKNVRKQRRLLIHSEGVINKGRRGS
jgi:hypothetical protein